MTYETNVQCFRAADPAAFDQVFRIRYHCYHGKGAIGASDAASFSDSFDTLPNQFSFLLQNPGEQPLATVRISVVRPDLGWTVAPSAKTFGDHPAFQTIARGPFVEASRLCFVHQAQRHVLYRLVANLVALADLYDAPWVVACPRVEHSMIYQRMFGFTQIAEPRQYFGVNFQTDLLAIPLEEIRQVAARVKPMREAWTEARQGLAVQ